VTSVVTKPANFFLSGQGWARSKIRCLALARSSLLLDIAVYRGVHIRFVEFVEYVLVRGQKGQELF
jgi:hypothetical protein